tara:strand:- start:91 stop:369 length:279 start_codon:yes stop_codon:yes gene_type:complete
MSKDKLKYLCESIDKMQQRDHIEILKIIKNSTSNINITENSNGCFINMNTVDNETVKNIEKYVDYFHKKEKELNEQEIKKNDILDSLNELDK